MVQKVPLGPIFHHLHVPLSFNNLRFCTNGIRSPLNCQSYLVSLFCWLEEEHGQGLVLSPGYFLARFVVETCEDNPKPVSNGHVPHESGYPPCLWGNRPKAPSCLLHWDQLCSCPGWRKIAYYPTVTVNVQRDHTPAVRGAARPHHKWLSVLKS